MNQSILNPTSKALLTLSTGAVEYTDCISAEE